LAATLRQETEAQLLETVTNSAKGSSSADSLLGSTQSQMGMQQQLAFLNQPTATALPSFLLSDWTPPARNATVSATRTAEANPYSSAIAGLQNGSGIAKSTLALDSVSAIQSTAKASAGALSIASFPRPTQDSGRGIHWIPTTSQSTDVIDKYVAEAKEMGISWVTLLNDGVDTQKNDYLVKKLTENGIEPVMRIYTDGGAAIEGNLTETVRHYRKLGVDYFQLYNEPNLRLENQGAAPDPSAYAAKWIDAARQVVAGGGLPGFGSLSPTPGLAPGAAPGDMDDLRFLRESLQAVKAQGGEDVLDRTWLSVHNYGDAHLRIRDYDQVVRQELGRSLPQIGTEAGIYPGDTLSQADATNIVANAYRYLPNREDYYFAYTYWIIANESGSGHNDAAWNHQALFRPDGQDPLVNILKQEKAV
ncbi:MAG: hypothetical protein IT190_09805, partial [Microbacteriaceae bacterium]|nr:hypothetical protein [Microbacteriaceae bacterium]